MIKRISLFIALLYVILLFGCPSRNPAHNLNDEKSKVEVMYGDTITDATGISFALSTTKRGGKPITNHRIVSLAPSITENIKILNAESKLIGRTDFCKVLTTIASIGTMLEPSIEKIIDLKPDLVLATKEGNRFQTVEKLRELQIPVFVFGESNSWKDIENNFRLCAKLLDKTNRAEEVVKSINVELFSPTISATHEKKVFIQLNVTPLMTAGRNTFINEIINYGGGWNIARDSILSWPTLSIEEIIHKDPDVIIISNMGAITSEAKKMWAEERFADITAVKNKNIFVMESDLLCQPTPVNFINAVRKMREHLK